MLHIPDDDLLGGAVRRRTRVRGFAEWNPQAATRVLLDQVLAVLTEYAEYLPLTLRQIFYRLVGAHDYEKTERAYDRLGELINRARRARLIDMDDVRDDGGTSSPAGGWSSADEWLALVREDAQYFKLDRSAGQPRKLILTCEAGGMVPQLGRVANPLGVDVDSSGGFESTTEKHKFARKIAREGRPVDVLDAGDHDPSGAHRYLAYQEDIAAFVRELGGEVTFTRLAVTPEQIARYRLPTAPPKPTDNRAFHGETCQAEAFAPDMLAAIVRDAIEQRIDRQIFERVLKRETRERAKLLKALARLEERS